MAAMRAPMERMSRQISRFVDLSGLRKVAQGFEWIGRAATSVLRTMVEIIPVLGTITGAATIGGMVALVKSYAAWSQELTSTADNLGTTTDELQKFQDAARLAGGNSHDMTASMQALYKATNDFILGRAAPATVQWLNQLHINVNDANGRLRTMSDLMPEVLDKVSKIENPFDRAAAATALLGDRGNDLVSALRRSSKSFGAWLTDAGRYTELSKQQIADLQAFSEAMGRTTTGFDHLGQQLSATLAKNFTPLLNKLSEFVEKNTPAILSAVDRLSTQFATWLSDEKNWKAIEHGALALCNAVVAIANNLDVVKTATEALFGLWAASKLLGIANGFIGIANAVAGITSAIGAAPGAAVVGGVGLLGALASVAALASVLALKGDSGPGSIPSTPTWTPEEMKKKQDEINQEQGYTGSFWHDLGVGVGRALGAVGHRIMAGPPEVERQSEQSTLGLPPSQQGQPPQQLAQLPGDYSWGDYGTRANNPGNMNYASWERASGRYTYTDPQTGGAHTMAVYNTMQEGIADQIRLLERNQARYGKTIAGALHGYAENPYIDKLGIDPSKPFDVATADKEQLASVLAAQYKIEGRKGSHTATREQILGGIDMARGTGDTQVAQGKAPALPVPPVPPPVNGKVDVAITHRNPPPDSAVTATGTGAVNVAPPRVERQSLADI